MPDIIVLLTDGQNNRGISPLQAAPYAVARRVRVYTIGFGTTNPGPLDCTPQQQGGVDTNGGFGPRAASVAVATAAVATAAVATAGVRWSPTSHRSKRCHD